MRRIEPRGGRIDGIYDDERTPGERCRCPFAEQHSFEPGIVLRGSLIVRVEYSMARDPGLRGRANLRSRSRSAVGGYAVSIRQNPLRNIKNLALFPI